MGVIYHQYCHEIRVRGFTVASSGLEVVIVGSFLVCCGCCTCWQVALPSKPSSVTYSLWNPVLSQSQLLQTGMWKRKWWKRLNFFGSGSTLMKETGSESQLGSKILSGAERGSKKFQRWRSGSEPESIKLQEVLEAEALKIWLLSHPGLHWTRSKGWQVSRVFPHIPCSKYADHSSTVLSKSS